MQYMRLRACMYWRQTCDGAMFVVSHGQKYGRTLWSCDRCGLTACWNDQIIDTISYWNPVVVGSVLYWICYRWRPLDSGAEVQYRWVLGMKYDPAVRTHIECFELYSAVAFCTVNPNDELWAVAAGHHWGDVWCTCLVARICFGIWVGLTVSTQL